MFKMMFPKLINRARLTVQDNEQKLKMKKRGRLILYITNKKSIDANYYIEQQLMSSSVKANASISESLQKKTRILKRIIYHLISNKPRK